ncbi:MAG: hypothetical protein OXE59_08725 [Bacteroidetes bacterium]|nr:hypothetical protein [Bacteroidota bacterium]
MENLGHPASVQYNDYTGTVAADQCDGGEFTSFKNFLVQKELISTEEFILAISFYLGDSRFLRASPKTSMFSVSVAVSKGGDSSNETLRGIRLKMEMSEFFSFFKRFECTMMVQGKFENYRGRDIPVVYNDFE